MKLPKDEAKEQWEIYKEANPPKGQAQFYYKDNQEYFMDGFTAAFTLCESRAKELAEGLELALSFAPKGPVPKGLDPTFYHTLVYEDEVILQERIDKARLALKNWNQGRE